MRSLPAIATTVAGPCDDPTRAQLEDADINTEELHLRLLLEHIEVTLGDVSEPHPGGWPGEVEVALLDAVFSARAIYGRRSEDGRQATGVHAVVESWRRLRAVDVCDDLLSLRETIAAVGFERLHALNKQRVPGRSPGRLTKWQAVDATGASLLEIGVRCADHVADRRRSQEQMTRLADAFTRTPGVGHVTLEYFLMLLGVPGVKADTMVRAFVDEALNPGSRRGGGREQRVSPRTAASLVSEAARVMDVDLLRLDHAIWLHQRDARKR